MQPTPDAFRHNVRSALAEIRNGRFEKIVLSRSITIQAQLDIQALLRRLAARNLLGYTFAIDRATGGAARACCDRTRICTNMRWWSMQWRPPCGRIVRI